MSGYTKGPWKKLVSVDGFISIGNDKTEYFGPALGFKHTIADVWGEADADLIAAAPELLEALKSFLEVSYRFNGCPDKQCDVCMENRRIIDSARSAIAKAEGK